MRVRPLAAVVALVAATAAVGTAAAAPPPADPPTGLPSAETHTVTLITGDRVTVSTAPGRLPDVAIRPGAGRERIRFQERRTRTSVRVVPTDAGPLLASGRLDERLFDVTSLIEQGYDDARRKDLPLIIKPAKNFTRSKAVRITRALPSVQAQAVRATKGTAFWTQVKNGSTGKVWLDGKVRASLDQSVPQIGAPDAWQAGYTGQGVTVAVLDTGVDSTHPDLADAVAEAKDFTDSPSGTADRYGHGTHVASIVTGDGAASGGRYKGVAPDVRLLSGKVLGDDGWGLDSQIIAGMEWAAGAGADIVNLSLGGFDDPGVDPLEQAVNQLTEQTGTLFVIAAGNSGPRSIQSPGSADAALTVGAVDKSDRLAGFSSTGPRRGDRAIKPDITAPGVDIVAARASGTNMGEPVGDHYTGESGTSMATPHVAGAAALLLQQHPDWTAAQLKPALMSSATPNAELTPFQQGTGRVDLTQAISAQVHPSAGSISMFNSWPHQADISRTVSYRNDSDQPVTLDLATSLPHSTIEPAQLTVPAHGSATATLHVNGTQSEVGDVTGTLTAALATGSVVARTVLAVYSEPESYDVTATVLDRNGKDVSRNTMRVQLMNLDTLRTISLNLVDGKPTARVPKGRYELVTVVDTADAAGTVQSASLMTIPELVVDHDRALTLDARTARQVTAKAPSKSAAPVGAGLSIVETFGDEIIWHSLSSYYGYGVNVPVYASPTGPVTSRSYEFGFHTALAEPVTGKGVPATYHLVFRVPGQIPERLEFRADPKNLAIVDTQVHAQGVPSDANRRETPWVRRGELDVPLPGVSQLTKAPEHRIEYYTAAADLRWTALYSLAVDGMDTTYEEPSLPAGGAYEPGRRYRLDLNSAAVSSWAQWNYRHEDRLFFSALPGVPSSAGSHFELWDPAGHSGTMTLSRDGEVIASTDNPLDGGLVVSLPPGAATYTARQTIDRDVAWSNLGTHSDTTWTFDWNGDQTEEYQFFHTMRPLITGGFDELNRAPSGKAFPLRVNASWTAPAEMVPPAPRIKQVTMSASYDDGETWQQLPVTQDGDSWRVVARHPAKGVGTGFVSLRTTIVDTAGSRVDQTVIRAYQLK